MKRLTALILLGVIYSGAASAQLPGLPGLGFEGDGVLAELLGPDDVVFSLVGTLQTLAATQSPEAFAPFIDATAGAGDDSLAQGSAGIGLNAVLTGLLVNQSPDQVAGGLQLIVVELVEGLQVALLGEVRFPVPALPSLPLPGLGGSGGGGGAGLPLDAAILTDLLGGLLGGGLAGGGLPGLDGLPLDPTILTGLLTALLGGLPGLDGLPLPLP